MENLAAIHRFLGECHLQRNLSDFDIFEKYFFLRVNFSFVTAVTQAAESTYHDDVPYQISSKSNENYRFYKQNIMKIVIELDFRKKHWCP